jgi:hypothetical protein
MTSAAQPLSATSQSAWRVSRDGAPVAVVSLRCEGGDAIVAADLAAAPAGEPHRFATLQIAEAFVGDLIASFAYLGCDVAAA